MATEWIQAHLCAVHILRLGANPRQSTTPAAMVNSLLVLLAVVTGLTLATRPPSQTEAKFAGLNQRLGILPNGCLPEGNHDLPPGSTACVASPGYPSKYPNNANSTWNIEYSSSCTNGTLTVLCTKFRIRGGRKCRKSAQDKLVIGTSTRSKTYCGKRKLRRFKTTSPHVSFHFKSNARRNAQGFLCHITARPTANTTCAECGLANTNRILNGAETSAHEYPWMVAIYTSDGLFRGSGNIYNSEWVITVHSIAYHSNLYVLLGVHNRYSPESTAIRRDVIQAIFPPNAGWRTNDFALVKLSSPVEFSYNIRPVCLPSNVVTDYTDRSVIIAGWGEVSAGYYPAKPHKVQGTILSRQTCEPRDSSHDWDINICTAEATTDGSGDFGSSMMVEENGKHYLIAMGHYPGEDIFIKVESFVDWVKSQIEE